jgi:GNAT superfamily N-acetyltransferase
MRPLDNPIIDKTKVITKIYDEYTLKYSSVNDVFYIVSAWHGDIKIGEASWRSRPYENGYTSRYISVIPEYQRKGIGVELVHLLKSINPNHKFGNMTPQGWNLMRAYYDKKIKQSLMSEVTSNVAKVKVLNEYATKTWQDPTLTPDEKSGLASFIFTEKQSLLKKEADDAKDMLSSNVAILVNNGQPAMQSICSETTILLKGYDSAGLDTQSSN